MVHAVFSYKGAALYKRAAKARPAAPRRMGPAVWTAAPESPDSVSEEEEESESPVC